MHPDRAASRKIRPKDTSFSLQKMTLYAKREKMMQNKEPADSMRQACEKCDDYIYRCPW